METKQLIVTGKHLLTMDTENTIIENGALVIDGDRIIAVGSSSELKAKYPAADLIAEKYGLIMPGLINTHTHAAMSCFRGLADDLPLMQWLQEYIFPREARLNGEMVYHSTLLSICEMIKSGTTSFCDMYLFAKDVARATSESGMRAWLGEVLYDFPSPNYGDLENGFTYMDELFAQYGAHELLTITVNPHAVYTCSPELLTRLGQVAGRQDALYHIHLSENQEEVDTCQERYGCTPVQHLEKLGLLHKQVLAAHCVKLEDDEIALLARRGVKVTHCQESNMKLASGTAPVVKMLDAGICVSIGTDGSASNNDVDMFGEMNTVAKIHKVARMDPTAMNAVTTLRAATMGGAEALGAEDMIGSLEAGKKADVIVLDCNQPHLTPMYNPVSHLVYAARGGDVIHSIINGQVVMHNRQIKNLDEQAVLAEMKKMSRMILSMK
jgi:5-methylthioadenosine/S-adenosylhomocysteine deaminase